MLQHPGMTSSGRRNAALFGLALALALPKQVPCEVPGRSCELHRPHGVVCRPVDVEPLGVFVIEWVIGRDLPIAYAQRVDC
ncbi:MAG: hypothetical protein HS111_17240 [Kofleriaceae bacterium]|nr:hypothetical protein [Kofleriaceae bacterium]MCL4223085.1 hypothetical protein [Myxococcales bacterium]